MSAALIPAQLVPLARTDADWSFDIGFPDEDWTGSDVKVAFARQGLPRETFEVEVGDGIETPTSEMACALRIPASVWADRSPGTYSAEVRKLDGSAVDDAAVFKVLLYQGLSDLDGDEVAPPPAGDGTGRTTAESGRVSAESTRQTQETARQTASANAIAAALTLSYRTISGTTGTIVASDAGLMIRTTNGSAVTLTLAADVGAGFNCGVRQRGAGQITFVAASGATLSNSDGLTKTRAQNSAVALEVDGNVGGTAAAWILDGDTA